MVAYMHCQNSKCTKQNICYFVLAVVTAGIVIVAYSSKEVFFSVQLSRAIVRMYLHSPYWFVALCCCFCFAVAAGLDCISIGG